MENDRLTKFNKYLSLNSPAFNQSDGYNCTTSLHPFLFPPNPNLNSPTTPDSEYVKHPPQYLFGTDELMERRNLCLSHLRDTAKEAEALRQENINLHIANIELSNQFNTLLMLQPSSLQNCHVAPTREHETASSAALFSPSLVDDFRGMRITDNESDSENLDVNRVSLPKSISVRSDGYLKAVQPSGSSSKGYGHVRAPNRIKRVKPVKKVYIRGGEEKPPELQVYDQGMSKTEMCNNWEQTGACRYGDHCYFAHGIEELRPVLRHPRFKTEVCRMVLNGDFCPYGRRCHFRHTLTDEEKLMAQLSNPSRPLRLK